MIISASIGMPDKRSVPSEEGLLDGQKTKAIIEHLFRSAKNQIFLSAYFTEGAFSWLDHLGAGKSLKLVIRARPNDFAWGASDLCAVRRAFVRGWDIRFISALHAKVYLLGNKIIVGSGNLTANGMHLMNVGNIELNSVIDVTEESRALVETVFREAQPFNENILTRMENFLLERKIDVDDNDWWPSEVVPSVTRDLFCNDFPQAPIGEVSGHEDDLWDDISTKIETGTAKDAKALMVKSNAYQWLLNKLDEREGRMHFGELTKTLHDTLADNPAPYRRTVKDLIANLLTFIQKIPENDILVERPRHSQVIRLR